MESPVPADESERLDALRQYDVLDTPPEPEFDALAALAAGICGAPISLITLLDADRQWIKARCGADIAQTPREMAFCAHAILQPDVFVIPDAREDRRFSENPMVTQAPHIRFYAGAPLVTGSGHALGTLCVLDHVPRSLSAEQRQALRALSQQVVAQLELRRAQSRLDRITAEIHGAAEALRASQEFNSRLIACSRDCIKVLDLDGKLLQMNEGGMEALEICDLVPFLHSSWIDFWEGEDREAARQAVEIARAGGTGRFVGYFETRIHRHPRWWDVVVSPILDSQGRPDRLLASSRDMTEQHLHRKALQDAQQFNKEIIEGAGEGILVYDSELRYQVFNPFMERLTGRAASDVLGRVALDVFPGLRDSGVADFLHRALQGQVVHTPDFCIQKHGLGQYDVWESATFAPHYDAQGRIVGVIGLVRDITERHLAEDTFRSIVIGTASATGSDFFPSLVRHLAAALQARYAFVTECDDRKRARALAFWRGNGFGELFEFDIQDTPCMAVLNGEICHYENGLQELFPLDTGLATWEARSYLGVPMIDTEGRVIGHIAILDDKPMQRNQRAIDLVKIFASRAAAELKRQRAEAGLQEALKQVQALQKQLEAENIYLQEEIRNEHNFEEMVGASPALLDVLSKVERIAQSDSTVLIHGETGVGKELIARALHSRSRRRTRALVKVNCGAIPAGLVESELFGHVKGAFTGALERRVGRFELAHGGTLFLDEVGELPLDTQVKLLRVLQEQEFEPVGSGRTIQVDVRILAASNRDLQQEVAAGRFRSDLFYRLNVLPLNVPPLRARRADIPHLVLFFLDRFCKKSGKRIEGVSQETMEVLKRYEWPGNIRELQNVIERGVALCQNSVLRLGPDLLPVERGHVNLHEEAPAGPASAAPAPLATLEEVEKNHILYVLRQTEGTIDGPNGAARILDLHPNTLRSRMKKLGIVRAAHEMS